MSDDDDDGGGGWLVGLGWVGWVGGLHEIITPPTLNFLCSYQSFQSKL